MSTRLSQIKPSLPHLISPMEQPIRIGVIHPLVNYIRNHHDPADAFFLRQFKAHRVTGIGETHGAINIPSISEDVVNRLENVCVRLFLRDIVFKLYSDPEARLRFLALEVDENAVEERLGSLNQMKFPPGTVNRKAFWIANFLSDENNLALKEALFEISRSCDEEHLEVVGIDDRSQIPPGMEVSSFLGGWDIEPNEGEDLGAFQQRVDEEKKKRAQEFGSRFQTREENICRNFKERILRNLGADRALIYYGMDHLKEAQIEPIDEIFGGRSFVNQLARASDGLREGDFYSVVTVYEGMSDCEIVSGSSGETIGMEARPEIPTSRIPCVPSLLRIYDTLRAEFPDDFNLGFDIDDVENAYIILHRSSRYRLGEVFDGYLFFRDLNSWDGSANLSDAGQRSQRNNFPALRITSVVPYMADPGNIVFAYGHVLTQDTKVIFGDQACPNVQLVNENVLIVKVPSVAGLADFEVAGRQVDLRAERQVEEMINIGSQDNPSILTHTKTQSFLLVNGFQYAPL